MGAQSGGAAAIRGFRLQTFYILRCLLEGDGDHFRPESAEDLLRLSPAGEALEYVQVKTKTNNLTITGLATATSEGQQSELPYLRRVLKRLQEGQARETLAVVGRFGPQMWNAWQGSRQEQDQIRSTLRRHQYTDAEVDLLFQQLHLEQIHEEEQDRQILAYLQEGMTAGDVQTARSVLAWWLFELSEQPSKGLPHTVTPQALRTKLQQIGRASSELRRYHEEWGTSLVPLLPDDLRTQAEEVLRQEFYQGTGARLEHILAGVDVSREVHLRALQEAFEARPLVIVHGASGQGKTALAYRYLYDHGLLPLSYRLGRLRDAMQGQQVLQALQAFLRQHRTELYLLIDAEPGDREWLDLLKTARGIQNLRVLLTIREEDWTRSQAELEQLSPVTLHLKFDEAEAQPIFEGLQQVRTSREFMRFEDAWRAFRQEGPLLEFVFMVTHEGQQLRARLQEQIERLTHEWRDRPQYQAFLHAAAFAAAANAAVDARRLATQFKLSMHELRGILQQLNEEHLLRQERGVIRGLHAIRSELLLDLLGDPDFLPNHDAFAQVLPATIEDDLELLTLNALIRLDSQHVLPILTNFHPTTWVGRNALARVLIWYAIYQYVARTKQEVKAAFDDFEFTWWLLVSPDLLNLRSRNLIPQFPDWDELSFFSNAWKKKVKSRRAAFEAYDLDLHLVGEWLRQQTGPLPTPQGMNDWLAAAELGFYSSFWQMPLDSFEALSFDFLATLPLFDAAEVFYGLSFVESETLRERLRPLRNTLVERLKKEGNVSLLREEEDVVSIHYVVPEEDALNPLPGDNPSHEGKLLRVDILHFLFPEKERYGSQGYGHQSLLVPEQSRIDDTAAYMKRETFPPRWGTQWNRTFHHLANLDFLLPDWQQHAEYQWETRKNIVRDLQTLLHLLPQSKGRLREWFSGPDRRNAVFIHALRAHALKRIEHLILPRCAVDPWGLAITSRSTIRDPAHWSPAVQALSTQLQADHYDLYFQATRKYGSSMNTFFRQAAEGIFALSKLHVSRDEEVRFRRQHDNLLRGLRLSKINLDDALIHLPQMQAAFRTAFAHLFSEDELAALESDERNVCRELAQRWPDFARVPPVGQHGGIQTTSAEVLERYWARLRAELERLRREGVRAELLETEERWEDQQPTLWITVELTALRDLFQANEAVIHALVRVLSTPGAATWTMDIIRSHWSHVMVIPTRLGRAMPRLSWLHSPDMLRNLERYFWRHQPTEVPFEQLVRLGLNPWLLAYDPWIVDATEKTLACLNAAQRAAGLHALLELEDLPPEVREELEQSLITSQTHHAQAVHEALQVGLQHAHSHQAAAEMEQTFSMVVAQTERREPQQELVLQLLGRKSEKHEQFFVDVLIFLLQLDVAFLNALDEQIQVTQRAEWLRGGRVVNAEQTNPLSEEN